MNSSTVKNSIVTKMSNILLPLGFKFIREGSGLFSKKEKDTLIIKIFFSIATRSTWHSVSCFHICFLEVEKVLMQLDSVPGIDFIYLKANNTIHPTIRHQFDEEEILRANVNSDADLDKFVLNVERYITEYGLPFIEHYSHLPNVLKRMDELTEQGKYWTEILTGTPELFFRGLIISKICKDPFFENKLKLVEDIFTLQIKHKDWIVAFENMKEILQTMK